MIIPLLDHSNIENIKRFTEFCKIFYNEYSHDENGNVLVNEIAAI